MKQQLFTHLFILVVLLSIISLAHRSANADVPDPAVDRGTSRLFLPVAIRSPTPVKPVIHSFTANPATINSGASSVLAWQVTGATSLSISPGIGAVTGNSKAVSPQSTTNYTLVAANNAGSVSAAVTVTVNGPPAPAKGFFIVPTPDIELPTSHPTVKVDPAGGVHVVFTPQSATIDNPVRPAYYAYCPANCASPAAFKIIQLGDGVDFAALDLDPQGRPRILMRLPVQSGAVYLFQFWGCDADCTNPARWSGDSIGYAYARQTGWVESFIHSFALDHQGRPRFIYYDAGANTEDPHWGVFYAYCNTDCTSPANWYETRLLDDNHARDFDLEFSPSGQPRLAFATYNSEIVAQPVIYIECNMNCENTANWAGFVLANTVSAGVTHFAEFDLEVATDGRPRLALYTGTGSGGDLPPNTLFYLACPAGNCALETSWTAISPGLPTTHGEAGLALALDGQNRPRLAYHAPMAAGFGLSYAWCDANCEGSAAGWQTKKLEASETVNNELPVPPWPGCPFPNCNPPIPGCTVSTWDSGVRPSLALDADGRPRIAYDADHHQGGACGTFIDTKLTRFMAGNKP